MTEVNWLFESDAIDLEDTDRLRQAVIAQGMEAKMVRKIDLWCGIGDAYPPGARVVFFGSLQMARKISQEKQWLPGAWLTLDNYRCSRYYQHFEKFLFNTPYELHPLDHLLRSRRKILPKFASDGCVFVRPDSGFKTFSGKVFEVGSIDAEFRTIRQMNRFSKRDLALVSSPKDVLGEWRLFVVGDEVVAGSQYRHGRRFKESPEVPPGVYEFARKVLAETAFRPDPAFVMDVCTDAGGDLWIMELNSISCAGIYAADAGAIVTAVSRLVAEIHP